MLAINNSILHVFDALSTIKVLSDLELDLEDKSVKGFISKCVKKQSEDSVLKTGKLEPNTEMHKQITEYVQGNVDFIAISRWIADQIFDCIGASENVHSADVVICDCTDDDIRNLFIMKYESKKGYVHNVQSLQNGTRNSLLRHFSILPNPSQKANECAVINLNTLEVGFFDKAYIIDGGEIHLFENKLFQCKGKMSPKETLKQVSEMVSVIAETYGENTVEAVAKVKTLVNEAAITGTSVTVEKMGREIFNDEILQEVYDKQISEMQIQNVISVNTPALSKSNKVHRIKTDTDIELIIPIDYYNNNEYMEFINNPDGTISISLKNINQITNK